MAKQKKLRSDAKLTELDRKLTEVERTELHAIAVNGSLEDLRAFASAHGVPIGLATASRTSARLRAAADGLLKRQSSIITYLADAKRNGTTLTEAALNQGALGLSDLIDGLADPNSEEGRALLLGGLGALTRVRNSEIAADRVQASREALALAERRVELAEKKLAEAKCVVEQTTISAEEQRKRLREIFAR